MIVIKHIPFNPESLIPLSTTYSAVDIQTTGEPLTSDAQPSTSALADVQPLTTANVQPSTSAALDIQPLVTANVQPSTSEAADVQRSTLAAADVQPSTSAAADAQPTAPGTVFILDFDKTRLPKHTYTEFYDIFQVEQQSLEIDGAIDFEKNQKRWTNYVNR